MANPTVLEIVKQFLELNGFEGLFNSDVECACKLDEFISCDGEFGICECEAGYIVPCEEGEESGFNYCVGRNKPE